MAKSKDAKKNVKKEAALTPKEKKAARLNVLKLLETKFEYENHLQKVVFVFSLFDKFSSNFLLSCKLNYIFLTKFF